MTIIIPSWIVAVAWVAFGFVLGATFMKWWAEAWAIHNWEPKPVWIPWRQIPCEKCFNEGMKFGRLELEREIRDSVQLQSFEESATNAEGGC